MPDERHDDRDEQPQEQTPRAIQRQLPSGSGRWRAGLALDRDVLAARSQQVALQHHERKRDRDDATATAAIRWYDGMPSLLVSLYR